MAKQTKEQIRAARGFKKEADKCSNCLFYYQPEKYNPAECTKDDFKIGGASWCNKHERKEA